MIYGEIETRINTQCRDLNVIRKVSCVCSNMTEYNHKFILVYLTKTGKKGLKLKQKIIEDVRNCVDKFQNVFVFKYRDIRSNHIKDIREAWENSRLYFGKNKVVAVGLGRSKEDEIENNIHKVR